MQEECKIEEYLKNRDDKDLLVDLRDSYTYSCGTIPGAINLPVSELRRLYELPREKRICVFCQYGEISREILELLKDAGYEACHLSGGYRSYLQLINESILEKSGFETV